MKLFTAATLAALSAFGALPSASAVEYSDFNAPPNSTYPNGGTVITGIRGASAIPGDVVITGSYVTGVGGATLPVIYEGNLANNNPAGWTILNPLITGQSITTSTLYGPNTYYYDNSLLSGGIRAVGSYKYSTGGNGDHGLMYTRINGVETWSTMDVPDSVAGGTVLNTIGHSTMGNYAVGNYDTDALTGHAFIYNITTNTFAKFTPVVAESVTAYGIWMNPNGTYTIAGGFSNLDGGSLDGGYLVDYDPNAIGDKYSHFTVFNYNNDPAAVISHFDGIVATADGYNLTGDQVSATPGEQLGFFASVTRNQDGTFNTTASWTSINVSGAEVTSGNTVYGNTTLGVYVDGGVSSSYLATVPEPSTYALIALGLGTVLFLRRRSVQA